MDFERAAHIINMDLTGVDPGPPPTHVRVLNEPDLVTYEWNAGEEYGIVTLHEMPDVHDQSTDTARSFTIEILFDVPTDLEASLATSAVAGFVRRRLGLDNAVIIGRVNF
jgi:hypothetical protein